MEEETSGGCVSDVGRVKVQIWSTEENVYKMVDSYVISSLHWIKEVKEEAVGNPVSCRVIFSTENTVAQIDP